MRRKDKKQRLLTLLFTFLLMAGFCTAGFLQIGRNGGAAAAAVRVPEPRQGLYSENAALLRRGDGVFLYEKNGEDAVYPASLTKLMTVYVALRDGPSAMPSVRVRAPALLRAYLADAATAGFLPGETVPLSDLLYGALLPSGAECCLALSEALAGSEQAFVERMNDMAASLGMDGTHFENVTGLHARGHVSTARDLALLLDTALEDDAFRTVFTARRHVTQATVQHPGGLVLSSSFFRSLPSPLFEGGRFLGGKTGFTDEAGLCLASLSERDGAEYVLVTTNAARAGEPAADALLLLEETWG